MEKENLNNRNRVHVILVWTVVIMTSSSTVRLQQIRNKFVDSDHYKYSDERCYQDIPSCHIVGRYARYHDIESWQRYLCHQYQDIVRTIDLGTTFEGRTMTLTKIGRSRPGKWSVWLDGGIHAREHITPATIIYIIDQLIEGYRSNDPQVTSLLEAIDWYLIPVVNPDGYEYTHTTDRLWRKNRRPVDKNCTGVDLNRNWDIDWGRADSDSQPCSGQYMGEAPQTELEVQNIVNFLLPRASQFIAFITYHSYGQRILTRWDHTGARVPRDHQELVDVGEQISVAMQESDGKSYEIGRAPDLTYSFSGGSADWAKAVAGIKYSYLIELRDDGYFGFKLPASEILPTGSESWAGVLALGQHILTTHGLRNVSGDAYYETIACGDATPHRQASNNAHTLDTRTLTITSTVILLAQILLTNTVIWLDCDILVAKID